MLMFEKQCSCGCGKKVAIDTPPHKYKWLAYASPNCEEKHREEMVNELKRKTYLWYTPLP